MKLHRDAPSSRNLVTGYGAGYVAINHRRTRNQPDPAARPHRRALGCRRLRRAGGERLRGHPGAGAGRSCCSAPALRQRFPAPALLRPLIEAGIGYEIMDLPAACRTFNILMAEGRRVAAALLIET
jgi:hypothetical protein